MSDIQPHPARASLPMFETNPIGVALIDRGGRVADINGAFSRISGLAPEVVIGMSEADFDSRLNACELDFQRKETDKLDLRALYFLSPMSQGEDALRQMRQTAELLREPLACIQGFAELLLTQSYDEDTRHNLTATLLSQVEVLANLINERLDIKRS
ncbi:MAG: PAS domain S-box protein [Gammaproteobacteria bacterium]|nr:PAS domain S-box protein [Gammaproteobacteria bacterium]